LGGVFKVIASVLVPVIAGSVAYGVYLSQSLSINSSISTNQTNSSALSSFSQSQTAFTGTTNTSSIHTPPGPDNGTIIQNYVQCANFSVPYKPLASLGTTFITTNGENLTAYYFQDITVEVLCNGCEGPQSNNKTYTQWPANTPLQWNGTITSTDDKPQSIPFGGVCDMSMGFSRVRHRPGSSRGVSKT
jgi:hypothetical protein